MVPFYTNILFHQIIYISVLSFHMTYSNFLLTLFMYFDECKNVHLSVSCFCTVKHFLLTTKRWYLSFGSILLCISCQNKAENLWHPQHNTLCLIVLYVLQLLTGNKADYHVHRFYCTKDFHYNVPTKHLTVKLHPIAMF